MQPHSERTWLYYPTVFFHSIHATLSGSICITFFQNIVRHYVNSTWKITKKYMLYVAVPSCRKCCIHQSSWYERTSPSTKIRTSSNSTTIFFPFPRSTLLFLFIEHEYNIAHIHVQASTNVVASYRILLGIISNEKFKCFVRNWSSRQ